jgi:hypothetical protein
MRKTIALVLFTAVVVPGVGCSSLKYEQKTPDGGVISFKATDREAALARIKQDYGDVTIESEYDPTAAKPGRPFDPNAAVKPSERIAAATGLSSLMGAGDEGKTHIKFAKKPMTGATPPGLPPAPADGVMQAGYSAKGGGAGALPTPNMSGLADGTCTTGN